MTASLATAAPYPVAALRHRPGPGLVMDRAAHALESDIAALRRQAAGTARRAYLAPVDARTLGRWGHVLILGGQYAWAQLSLPAPQAAATLTDSPMEGL